MRKIFIVAMSFIATVVSAQQRNMNNAVCSAGCECCSANINYEIGLSLSLCSGKAIPTEAQLQEIKDAGIEWVEVIMNPLSRYCPDDQILARFEAEKALLEKVGLKVWSCHLPYGKSKAHNYDISVLDPALREEALSIDEQMIALAAGLSPRRIVLHPSAEPIDSLSRPERLACSRESIGRLAVAAKAIGAVLCVEDLPRTCLGNTSEELLSLIEPYPDVMVTFDVNHILKESHDHFFEVLGSRIAHIHASDYDGVDERHWLEGTGIIDWPRLLRNLRDCGYRGVFMHEVRKGDNVTPATIHQAYRQVVCGE